MSLEDIKTRKQRADDELDRLTAGNPGTNWRWSIPANPERDSDLILADSIADIPRLAAALDAVLDAHREIECLDEYGDPTGFYACDNCKDLDETSGERVHETYPCFTVKEVQRALAGQRTMGAFRKSVMDALAEQDAA